LLLCSGKEMRSLVDPSDLAILSHPVKMEVEPSSEMSL